MCKEYGQKRRTSGEKKTVELGFEWLAGLPDPSGPT
jgi:hypothetical protein